MRKEMKFFTKPESVREGTRLGSPVLVDVRGGVFHRASSRELDPGASALLYVDSVRGTSGIVVQPYHVPASPSGQTIPVEPALSDYDASQLLLLRGYRS